MPEKSREERIRRAKAEGKTVTIKESDVEPKFEQLGMSRHAEKKSRGVIGEEHPEGRSTSHRVPPGHGHSVRPPLPGDPESVLPPDARRTALPREEAEAERIREGHPSRLSPSGKKRGEP